MVSVLWGTLAEICLGGVLLIWLLNTEAGSRALFGSTGSSATLVVAMVLTGVALVTALMSPERSAVLFWVVAFPLFIVTSLVAVLAFERFFHPKNALDVMVGLLLAGGVVAAFIVAWQVVRL